MESIVEFQHENSARAENALHLGDHQALGLEAEEVKKIQRSHNIEGFGLEWQLLRVGSRQAAGAAVERLLRGGSEHIERSVGADSKGSMICEFDDASSGS